MNLLLAAAGVVALALAGTGALRAVWPSLGNVPRPARLALGFCAGAWLVGLLFFFAYLAGLSFSRRLIIVPVIVLAVGGAIAMLRGAPRRTGPREWPMVLPVLLCGLALALSWARPVYGYDAVMMWALKAKMMFFARTWPATMFDPFTTAHTEYPPLVPGAQAYVFFWLGEFDDVASRVVFAAFFAAGAALLAWVLGELRVRSRWVWVTLWCATPIVMDQVKLSYADMPLAVYLIVFYGALAAWLREPARRDWVWLAGIFGGMAFWVKQDALIGVAAGLAALLAARRFAWDAAGIAGAIAAPWPVFVWAMRLPGDFSLAVKDLPAKSAQVTQALWEHGVTGSAYALFWPVMVVALAAGYRRLRAAEARWLLVSVTVGVAGMFAVYWFAKPDLVLLLPTSLERVLLGVFVPALLLVALVWPETRAMKAVIAVAVVALGLFAGYRHGREWVEVRREFAGKTLAQQRVLAVEPGLRRQIAGALDAYPPGTHVQVLPKRSLWRHRFYYETYPYLVVDNASSNVIELVTE